MPIHWTIQTQTYTINRTLINAKTASHNLHIQLIIIKSYLSVDHFTISVLKNVKQILLSQWQLVSCTNHFNTAWPVGVSSAVLAYLNLSVGRMASCWSGRMPVYSIKYYGRKSPTAWNFKSVYSLIIIWEI